MLQRIEPIDYETVKKIVDIIPENYNKISVIAYENEQTDVEDGISIRINSVEITYNSRELFKEHYQRLHNPKRITFQHNDYKGSVVIECLGRKVEVSGHPPPLTYADFERIGLEKTGYNEPLIHVSINF